MSDQDNRKFMHARLAEAVRHLRNVQCWERKHHKGKPADVEFEILLTIAAAPSDGIILKQLYESLPCAMPTAVKCIKRLTSAGRAILESDALDRRFYRIRLTPAGQSFLIDYYEVQSAISK
jgi:DNA-binding MarR family transcriptional regulator